jgi:hypothetical protein
MSPLTAKTTITTTTISHQDNQDYPHCYLDQLLLATNVNKTATTGPTTKQSHNFVNAKCNKTVPSVPLHARVYDRGIR